MSPKTPRPTVVWERPKSSEVLGAIRDAMDDHEDAIGAQEAARDRLHELVREANREHHVTQERIGKLLGVTKTRVNAIIRDLDSQTEQDAEEAS